MIRHTCLAAILCSLALTLGCGGGEVKPTEDLAPEVSQEEIQKNIREGMQQGGMDDRYKGRVPGGAN